MDELVANLNIANFFYKCNSY